MRLTFAAVLLLALTAPGRAQESPRPGTAVRTGSTEASSFIDALIKIASRFEFPLAVEWVKSPDALRPINLARSGSTASEALNAVVSAQSGYAWRIENGIVHVFRKTMANDPRNPLNVRIGALLARRWTVHDADNFLFQSIGEAVRSTGPKILPVPSPVGSEPLVPLAGGNGGVREVLNQIITASKMKIWIATFPETLPLTLKGYWETTPMYDPKYVKPENQPFWIFLRWGDTPWKRLESREP